ncbi:hypothetical protein GCM10010991_26040 [Gemmobacter aquaticus]|uniref:Uncharacterized protein n=1 Tax=Gemmobacter aquaticus TaxID=490185 RepID=A0A917YKT0_9RHOB|nr:hypothetical protein [Gemmobacter aquaticus]GGO34759.1 hypothetical protein GCM10010991_26040 [Gemmobacter aquaticus]
MNDLPEDERERAESIVRDQKRFRLTGRELWLTQLSPDGRLLVRIALYCAIIVFLGFCTFRGLIGGSTTSWNQRLTVIVDTPAGEVRGSSVVKISKTETMGPLVLMEARGVSSKTRGEAVALEVLPGRWLFALLSGDDDGKGNAGQLVYHAFRLGEGRELGTRSYRSNMHDLRAQPRDTPAPIPPEAYPVLVTFDDITKPETVRKVDPSNLAATFGEGVRLRGMTLEVTRDGVTEGKLEGLLKWIRRHPEPHLMPGDGRISDIPFAMTLAHGDFLAAPQ